MECVTNITKDIEKRIITVRITGYDNLIPVNAVAEASLKVAFCGDIMLDTQPVPIVSNYLIPVDYSFKIEFNWNDSSERDKIMSCPITMNLYEIPGTVNEDLHESLYKIPQVTGKAVWQSPESIMEIQEALLGQQEKQLKLTKNASSKVSKRGSKLSKVSKESKGSKASKASQASKASKASRASKSSKDKKSDSSSKSNKKKKGKKTSATTETRGVPKSPNSPQSLGIGSVDLMPLFLGNLHKKYSVVLKQFPEYLDDRMVIVSKLPLVNVEVSINVTCDYNSVFNITVESMFNIPMLMSSGLEYKLHIPFPSTRQRTEGISMKTLKRKMQVCESQRKYWASLSDEENPAISQTEYWISYEANEIKNPLKIDIPALWASNKPRIEFNYIKRILLNTDNISHLKAQVMHFRKIPVEILIAKATTEKIETRPSSQRSLESKKSPKKIKKEKSSQAKSVKPVPEKSNPDYLHLMGYIDISRLHYPGIRNTRVIVPLSTYHAEEILNNTGLDDSFFFPKPPPIIDLPKSPEAGKKIGKKKKDKSSKSSKASKGKASKGTKGKGKSKGSSKSSKSAKDRKGKGGNMADKLPPPPIPEPPSVQVNNENGDRTFLIVEIEVSDALFPPRDLETLRQSFEEIIPKNPDLNERLSSSKLAEELNRETLRSVTEDLILHFQSFRGKIPASRQRNAMIDTQENFMSYLKDQGLYQMYVSSVNKSATAIASDLFCYTGSSSSEYQKFISEIYTYLVTEVNRELNMTIVGPTNALRHNLSRLLGFAKEAIELRDFILADRNMLQRICVDQANASSWFDYAIFHMSVGDEENAFECIREALILNPNHYHALLMYAMLLERKGRFAEAETCLLTVTVNNPTWIEAWGALYLLYQKHNRSEGMDMSEEMGNRYLRGIAHGSYDPSTTNDYLDNDELSWTTSILPATLFYRTASLLVKMKLLDEAEILASNELVTPPGINDYFMAVIAYYRGHYCHAIKHLDEAKELHGRDFAVNSLRGHCFMQLNEERLAIKEYEHVMLSYFRPDDIHLIYLYSAFAYDRLQMPKKALESMLLACKFGGTPTSWMGAGVLFMFQGEDTKAEQCLSYANLLDNRMGEIWGYLSLVNLRLDQLDTADMCYVQAIKNGVKNYQLINEIKATRKKIAPNAPFPDDARTDLQSK